MKKEEVIAEIKRITELSGGNAPGSQKFTTLTNIRKADWYPHLWLRWSDALEECGYKANNFNEAYSEKYLIEKYVELMRTLKRFPIEGDIRVRAKGDSNFPSHGAFLQLGSKNERVQKILSFCKNNNELSDVINYCNSVKLNKTSTEERITDSDVLVGYVYMLKHGSRNEYKIGRTNNPIRREGEIRLELPEKLTPIHYIETDDPAGIERYWHHRFSKNRKEGEWFSLDISEVRAFKRWKKIF